MLWIGTADGGLNRFENGRFQHINAQNGLYADDIYSITEDRAGSFSDMTAGDFKGDGGREINRSHHFELWSQTCDLCRGPQEPDCHAGHFPDADHPGRQPEHGNHGRLDRRGRFNSASRDQLAVAFSTAAGPAYVGIVDFEAGTLNAREASPKLGSPAGNIAFPYGYIQVKTGKFGLPNNPYDQTVYHSSSPQSGGRFLEILTVNPTNFGIGGTSPIPYNQFPGATGIHKETVASVCRNLPPEMQYRRCLLRTQHYRILRNVCQQPRK